MSQWQFPSCNMSFYSKKFCCGDKLFSPQPVAWISAGLKSFAMKQGQNDLTFNFLILHLVRCSYKLSPLNPHLNTSICFMCTNWRTVSATCFLCVHTKRLVPTSRPHIMSHSVCRPKLFTIEFITGKLSTLPKVAIMGLLLRRTLFRTLNLAFLHFNILCNNNWGWLSRNDNRTSSFTCGYFSVLQSTSSSKPVRPWYMRYIRNFNKSLKIKKIIERKLEPVKEAAEKKKHTIGHRHC